MMKLMAGAALAALVIAASPGPAHAGLFDGGDDLLDGIKDWLDDWDLGWDGLSDGFTAPIEDRAEIDRMRAAVLEAAGSAGPTPALLAAQILQYGEDRMATELLWQAVQALENNDIESAIAAAEEVRNDLGEQGVRWDPGGALAQHETAYVEPPGPDVEDPRALLGHLTEMVALKTAASQELAKILASQVETQVQDTETLRTMLESTMAAVGTTQAVQGLAQMQGLLIEKIAQQQDTNAAFHKLMAAQISNDEAERMIAMLQRNFDNRDMLFAEPLGVPGNSLGGGGGFVGVGY